MNLGIKNYNIQKSVKILFFATLASIMSPQEGGNPAVGIIQNIS